MLPLSCPPLLSPPSWSCPRCRRRPRGVVPDAAVELSPAAVAAIVELSSDAAVELSPIAVAAIVELSPDAAAFYFYKLLLYYKE